VCGEQERPLQFDQPWALQFVNMSTKILTSYMQEMATGLTETWIEMHDAAQRQRVPGALLFLIGMPAVGKTWWGKEAAKVYGLSFTDLDSYIEEREGATIAELFERYGEAGFRDKEHGYLTSAIAGADLPGIIGCGGGTPCFHNNLQVMKESGSVIYLQADVPYLLTHIADSSSDRPLLRDQQNLRTYLEELLAQRRYVYEQAHYILDAKNVSIITFEEIITTCSNRR
jgi:shikimate kinase